MGVSWVRREVHREAAGLWWKHVSGVGTGMATSEVFEYGYALRLGSVAEAVVCCATRLRYVGVQDRCTGMMIW